MRLQSKKHSDVVEMLSKAIGGERTDNHPLRKGSSYPDIILPERDIEVEVMTNSNLRRKSKRYDKKRKRTMIIIVPDDIKENFDEIILLNI